MCANELQLQNQEIIRANQELRGQKESLSVRFSEAKKMLEENEVQML